MDKIIIIIKLKATCISEVCFKGNITPKTCGVSNKCGVFINHHIVHLTISPFNCTGVFAEATGVAKMWQSGVMVLTRARKIVRLVISTL